MSWAFVSLLTNVTREPWYTRTCRGATPELVSVSVAPSVVGIGGDGPGSDVGAFEGAAGGAEDVQLVTITASATKIASLRITTI